MCIGVGNPAAVSQCLIVSGNRCESLLRECHCVCAELLRFGLCVCVLRTGSSEMLF